MTENVLLFHEDRDLGRRPAALPERSGGTSRNKEAEAMRHRYGILAIALLAAVAVAAPAQLSQTVSAYKNCVGLYQAGAASITLTAGEVYSVTVEGDAQANESGDAMYDGVFVFYYDNTRPNHPVIRVLDKGDSFEFTASSAPFMAFLVDKSLKDVPDNSGSMQLTIEGAGSREVLMVDAVFNCVGLEDFGAIKNEDTVPERFYTISPVSGDAETNGTGDGAYDGVCIFTRDFNRPLHPIIRFLEYGEELNVQMHATSWIYMFFVDESFATMGNNGGTALVQMSENTAVDEQSWATIKALFR
jgi:hypothetical protein